MLLPLTRLRRSEEGRTWKDQTGVRLTWGTLYLYRPLFEEGANFRYSIEE